MTAVEEYRAAVEEYRAAAGKARRGAWERMMARRRALRVAALRARRRVRSCATMADAQAEARRATDGGAA